MSKFTNENEFQKLLVKKIPLVNFSRIENRVGSGIPDLLYAMGERKGGFIELKAINNENCKIHLRDAQKTFFNRMSHSFNVWLLVGMKDSNSALLLDGVMVDSFIEAKLDFKPKNISHHGNTFLFDNRGQWDALYRTLYHGSHAKKI